MIELMVTLAILAIIMSLAAPSFNRLVATNRIASTTNELTSGMKLARSEAIRRGQPVTARAKSTTEPGDFALEGWEVFPDANSSGSPETPPTASDGQLIRSFPANGSAVRIRRVDCTLGGSTATCSATLLGAAARRIVIFDSRGLAVGGEAFFRVCDTRNTSVVGRVVRVSVAGHVSVVASQATCTGEV